MALCVLKCKQIFDHFMLFFLSTFNNLIHGQGLRFIAVLHVK